MSQERRNYYEQNDYPEEIRTRPRKRRRSPLQSFGMAVLYVAGVISISMLLACAGWVAANDVLALNKTPKEAVITVRSNDDFNDVVDKLKQEGLIEYKFLFKLFAKFTNGQDKVTMGTYTLDTDMDYRALLAGMSVNSSSKAEVTVTIPEGYTVAQIFKLLEDKGVATVEDLNEVAATHDYAFSFLQDIPLGNANRLEGYLYPDTYTFYTPHSALYAINKMLVNFDSRFTDEMRQQVADSGSSIRDILTVASMIERETDSTDHGKIASVIYNRLNNPSSGTMGKLQIDATLYYITGYAPTEADKSIESPYNTYLYAGLPAGPIANPGMKSIQAAMNPEKTRYFYYALGDDGVHHFFATYDEHTRFINSQELYKD